MKTNDNSDIVTIIFISIISYHYATKELTFENALIGVLAVMLLNYAIRKADKHFEAKVVPLVFKIKHKMFNK